MIGPVITVGVLGLGLAAAVLFVFLGLAHRWLLQIVFVRLSWIPPTALMLEGLFFAPLAQRPSYSVLILPVLTCVASLLLFIGFTLVGSARARGEPYAALVGATLVASIPAVLLATYLVARRTAVPRRSPALM